MSRLLSAVLLTACFAGFADAAEIDLNQPRAWRKQRRMSFSRDGVMRVVGRAELISARSIPVRTDGRVKLSFEYRRAPGSAETLLYAGFWPLDADKARINPVDVRAEPRTATKLLRDAAVGDTRIVVARPARWARKPRVLRSWYVVFEAKADLSDLPNRAVYRIAGAELSTVGEWVVTLKAPLDKTFPADTALRCQSDGPGMYAALDEARPDEEWRKAECVITEFKTDFPAPNRWWAGTKYARVRIVANANANDKSADNAVQEFRNFQLEYTE